MLFAFLFLQVCILLNLEFSSALRLCEHSPHVQVLPLLTHLGQAMSLVVILLQLPHIHNAARHCRVCSSSHCSLGNAPYTCRRYKGSPSQWQAGKGLGGQKAQCLFQGRSCKSAQTPQVRLAADNADKPVCCRAELQLQQYRNLWHAQGCKYLRNIDCVGRNMAFYITRVSM